MKGAQTTRYQRANERVGEDWEGVEVTTVPRVEVERLELSGSVQ